MKMVDRARTGPASRTFCICSTAGGLPSRRRRRRRRIWPLSSRVSCTGRDQIPWPPCTGTACRASSRWPSVLCSDAFQDQRLLLPTLPTLGVGPAPDVQKTPRLGRPCRTCQTLGVGPSILVLGAVMPLAEPGSEVSVTAAGLLSMMLLAGMYAGLPSAGAYVLTRHLCNRRVCRNRRPAVA